ncbi:MAG TPA: FecR domain-containing protein [Polyangiaceae bacterium]|nr:FecR domain-containing protein [Polyangiaceae bacterium]
MTEPDRSESRLAALAGLVRLGVKAPTPLALDRGFASLRARLANGSHEPRFRLRVLALAAWLLACLGGGALFAARRHGLARSPAPVAVSRVEGGAILEGGYLAEVGRAGVRLYFNEGSQFALMPGARGRLRSVTPEGARLALDHGSASFRITPNLDRRWWVEAGPFVVSVKGTRFSVRWDPTVEEFVVRLTQGKVVVSGPIVGDEFVLRPGQNLEVNLSKHESVIREDAEETPPGVAVTASAPVPSASAAPVPEPAASAPSVRASAAPPTAPARRWREAVAGGQWDRILSDVERDGVDQSLRTLSNEELFELADAARYRRRPDLARAALLAERERFPSSSRAVDALFLLGRVEELEARPRAAIERYDGYLALAPHGTYAAEALGRKLILVEETAGRDAASRVAEEYLSRFPSGSYADAARALSRAR